jgi:hypothetical protein
MNLLFLGVDDNHLKIMSIIKKDYLIEAVGYDNINIPSNVSVKNIDEINLEDYEMIFISESFYNNYINIFKDYNGKAIIFKGLSKIKLSEIKNEMKVNYLIDELKSRQNISKPNVFIFGYDNLGAMLSHNLLSMGINIRVGITCWDEIYNLLHHKISCIYANNNNTLAALVENDEFIINTTNDKFSPNIMEKIHNYLIDINDYDIEKEEYSQKTYASK